MKYNRKETTDGMAMNVRQNLMSFGMKVYILTNESMPDTIKIGITDNLERRMVSFTKDQITDVVSQKGYYKQGADKKKLIKTINDIKKKGGDIAGYAATSKSTTILNYCKIGSDKIDYICDTTPEKIGKYTPGTHIPVVSMDHFRKKIPSSVFLFAWNHKKEIFKKEKKIMKKTKWFAHIKI